VGISCRALCLLAVGTVGVWPTETQRTDLKLPPAPPGTSATTPAAATLLDEATRTQYIGMAMKICMEDLSNDEAMKRLWTRTNISNYCGCDATTVANNMTLEDLNYFVANQTPPDFAERVVNPAHNYCSKQYLPTPDISAIKDKKW
jgi:hypothetical protein